MLCLCVSEWWRGEGLHFQAAACPSRNEADQKSSKAETTSSYRHAHTHRYTHIPSASYSRWNLLTGDSELLWCSVGGSTAAAATWHSIWRPESHDSSLRLSFCLVNNHLEMCCNEVNLRMAAEMKSCSKITPILSELNRWIGVACKKKATSLVIKILPFQLDAKNFTGTNYHWQDVPCWERISIQQQKSGLINDSWNSLQPPPHTHEERYSWQQNWKEMEQEK